MKRLMSTVVAVAAFGLFAFADEATWFAEDAATLAEAIEGKTDDGTWSNYGDGQLTVDADRIVLDADDATPIAYRPDGTLTANAASFLLTDITFDAARGTLPELPTGAQAAVAITTNANGECVFAVADNGAWDLTTTSADSGTAYAVKVDFTYADTKTVGYSVSNGTGWVTIRSGALNPATAKVSTAEFAGSGSFTALVGAYPSVTIDFGNPLPDGMASVTVNGEELVDGKATVPQGAAASIVITPEEGWTVKPTEIALDSVTKDIDYTGANFPAKAEPLDGWAVVSANASATNVYASLSAALAALQDGETLMPAVAGESDLSGAPTTFSTNDFRAVAVDCPFVITKDDVTVDFRGRVLRDSSGAETDDDYLVSVVGATNVTIRNGFLFGTTWRDGYTYTPGIDHRGFAVSDGARAIVSNCVVFIAATSNSVSVTEGSRLRFVNCWVDGQGDGAEKVFHAANASRLRFVDTKGFWNPENFWGVTDGVVDTLPAITGEQFALEDSYLCLDNTIVSNTVTHWSAGKVATPVTFSGTGNALVLTNDAFITAITGGVAVAKVELSDAGAKLESDADFAANDEIVGGADGLWVVKSLRIGGGWFYMTVAIPSGPLPSPDEVDTDLVAQLVMADAAPALREQITTVGDYTNFYAWVESAKLDHATAKKSRDAFFSFATAQDGLVDTAAVSNGAVKVVATTTVALGTAEAPTNAVGVAVAIKDLPVGDAAKSEYLMRVFGATGAFDLGGKFLSQNVAYIADEKGDVMTPVEGCVLFFVVSHAHKSPLIRIDEQEAPAAPSADRFFLKATVDPCNAEKGVPPQDYGQKLILELADRYNIGMSYAYVIAYDELCLELAARQMRMSVSSVVDKGTAVNEAN